MTDPMRPASDPGPPSVSPDAPGVAPSLDAASAAPVPASALPLASVIANPKSSAGRGTSLLLVLAGAMAIGGIAFAAGRLVAPAAHTAGQFFGNGQVPDNGQGLPGRGAGFAGISLAGTVDAVSADSITVKLESGTSITILLDADTDYHAATAAPARAPAASASAPPRT